jgi:integrase/recombinase XerD
MSKLRRSLCDYLALRRSLGSQLQREDRILLSLVAYVEAQKSKYITAPLALVWSQQGGCNSQRRASRRLSQARQFARYMSARDPRTEVPAKELLPCRSSRLIPYLYSEQEVERLMAAASCFKLPWKSRTYGALIGLLAITGMRVGEAIRLELQDFDAKAGVLTVRESKFGKSRELILHSSTAQVLQAYLGSRSRRFKSSACESLLVSTSGTRLNYKNVHHGFLRMVRRAGLWDQKPHRPRIHDLRHSFAVRTLIDWYDSDLEVEPKLPLLSTYLGHVSPSSTYWYLQASPELVSRAARKLEQKKRRAAR